MAIGETIEVGKIVAAPQLKDRNFQVIQALSVPVRNDEGVIIGWRIVEGDGFGNIALSHGGTNVDVPASTDDLSEAVFDTRSFLSKTIRVKNTGANEVEVSVEAGVILGQYDVQLQDKVKLTAGETLVVYDNKYYENVRVLYKNDIAGQSTTLVINLRGIAA